MIYGGRAVERVLRREFPRSLTRELVFRSGNATTGLTRLRGSELLPESRVFLAIFARIYAAGLEWPRETAVPAGVG